MAGIAAGIGIATAVSMGLAEMVVNSGKAFDEMVKDAKDASIEIGKISFTSSDQSGLARGAQIYQEQIKKIRDQEQAGTSKGARFLEWADEKFGGKTKEEKDREKAEAKKKLEFARQQINERSLEISKNTQEVAKLTAAGDEEGLERLQRKIKLEEKIYELALSGLGRDEIAKAVAAETALSEAKDPKALNARKKAAEEEKRQGQEIYDSDKARVSAEERLIEAQTKKLSLSQRIAMETEKLAEAEKFVAQQSKIGTEASKNRAIAKALELRLSLQELAQQRAAQFVGKSSAAVRKADRDEAKQKKELDKAGKRAIEADIRKADAANRRAGGLGLNDAQKRAMREQGNKALGKDLAQNAAERSAKSLDIIEKAMDKLKEKLGVAK